MSTQPEVLNASTHAYVLPPLPYGYADLEPVIDEETMHLHHDKHHQAYTDGTNAALARHPQWQGMPIEDVLRRLSDVPAEIRQTVRNQGGGYANHNLFWECLSPRGGRGPDGELAAGIERCFGSLQQFKKKFEEAGAKHFGSGWVFLASHEAQLEIIALPNQDSPLSMGRVPLLACDLWEHAYYLKYNNRRAQWLGAWWEVVDWQRVSQKHSAPRT